jgi:uncharacterized protein YgbK (DUF1537 family)
MPEAETVALHRLIAANLRTAVGRLEAAGVMPPKLSIVSRSDSTLRGHFPAEIDTLQAALGPFDAVFLIPFFAAGGRMTIDDVHYVAQGQWLLPAATTPFARDAVFGYRSSHLRDWVAEKTAGRVPADAVASISLDQLRQGGPTTVLQRLRELPAGSICVVNAAAERDLEVFVCGLLDAEAQGRRYLFRTAASFVAARLGLAPRPLLDGNNLQYGATSGGLTVVGSYVPCSSEQLQRLLDRAAVVPIELDVPSLLDANRREETVRAAIADLNHHLGASRDVVLYTSRQLITRAGADAHLETGRIVSEAIVQVVRRLAVTPRYLIAKGGITSSDVATRALGVRRALVLGQILPGVPSGVWAPRRPIRACPTSSSPVTSAVRKPWPRSSRCSSVLVLPRILHGPKALHRSERSLEGRNPATRLPRTADRAHSMQKSDACQPGGCQNCTWFTA